MTKIAYKEFKAKVAEFGGWIEGSGEDKIALFPSVWLKEQFEKWLEEATK